MEHPTGPRPAQLQSGDKPSMSIAVYLKDIGRGAAGARSLSSAAAHDLMVQVLAGRASPAQTGAFLIAMRMKGETLAEITGFLRAAQAHCLAVP